MKRAIIAVCIIGMVFACWSGILVIMHANRPPITILSENVYPDLLTGGEVLVVEYAIAGHAYAVTFRGNQEGDYLRFKAHLDKAGRIE
jgi:hypothetical protein